jgi:hypothetical protein
MYSIHSSGRSSRSRAADSLIAASNRDGMPPNVGDGLGIGIEKTILTVDADSDTDPDPDKLKKYESHFHASLGAP